MRLTVHAKQRLSQRGIPQRQPHKPMNDKIEVSCNAAFKAEIEDAEDEKGLSMAEFMREAARRELQRSMIGDQE